MIDEVKIKAELPNSELGKVRPCTTPGTVQFHLLVSGKVKPGLKILDLEKLLSKMKEKGDFSNIKYSRDLGVIKASYASSELSILESGRVVIKKAKNEFIAGELLLLLAPILSDCIY